MVNVLDEQSTVANRLLAELRDVHRQQDRSRFRFNLERLGELMAYEISSSFRFKVQNVTTPLGTRNIGLPEVPVLVTILRAGLPFFQGFQRIFDQSEAGFIGTWREEGKHEPSITMSYQALPAVEGRVVILIDPMLATGKSLLRATEGILRRGRPAHLHIASLVAAPEGIDQLESAGLENTTLWTWSVDERLDDRFYIVPGLGDAGDLCFGEKE